MSPFARSFASDSPVLTMSPRPTHVGEPEMAAYPYAAARLDASAGINSQRAASPFSSSYSAAGRKRSRDEAAPNLNADPVEAMPSVPAIQEAEENWEYGEGMVLIKPNQGYVADASSQSGTWIEEKAAQDELQKSEAAMASQHQPDTRPALRSHKSQRLDNDGVGQAGPGQSAMHAAQDDGAAGSAVPPLPLQSGPASLPVVDDFTVHLGIGWRRISDDEHIQAAARGWARYIENHYPISAVTIRLESKGLQSYLVEAAEGFHLFSEDLKQGRLVSKDVGRALQNLKFSPPTFDGSETLFATESPAAVAVGPPSFAAQVPVAQPPHGGGSSQVEMDLS